jgi:hypothetical protein
MFLNKKFKSFENVVAIALQSVFHLEIYQNYVFFFIFVWQDNNYVLFKHTTILTQTLSEKQLSNFTKMYLNVNI